MSDGRLPNGVAKSRILEAAQALFADVGFETASFRDITARAGVSLSAIHYHFGSKLGILEEIFSEHARRLTEQRAALLHHVSHDAEGRPVLDSVLEAFLRPSFLPLNGESNDMFNKLRLRLSVEATPVIRGILGDAFDVSDRGFIAALAEALPDRSESSIYWRFHFMVGAMLYTMADPGQLEGLSHGACSSADSTYALKHMVSAFSAAFRALEADPASTSRPARAAAGKPRRKPVQRA